MYAFVLVVVVVVVVEVDVNDVMWPDISAAYIRIFEHLLLF